MVLFEPTDIVAALVGGALIALATTLNLLVMGRITGLSGIFNTLIKVDSEGGFRWKLAFFTGLVGLPYLLFKTVGETIKLSDSATLVMFDPP